MASVIYLLCAIAALLCTGLLIRAYYRSRYRLLLWSGLCFAGLTLNNLVLVLDKIVFTSVDLSIWRTSIALLAMAVFSMAHLGCGMMNAVSSVLMGSVAMASCVAAIFFLRFWRQTRDSFFLFFSVAFGLDALTRFVLGMYHLSEETEPLFYVARLLTFGLIIAAIIRKNCSNR